MLTDTVNASLEPPTWASSVCPRHPSAGAHATTAKRIVVAATERMPAFDAHRTGRHSTKPSHRILPPMPVRDRLAAPASVDPSVDDRDANLVQLPEPLDRPFELVS